MSFVLDDPIFKFMRRPIHQGLKAEVRALLDEEQALSGSGAYLARTELHVRRWRLIHKYVHAHAFSTPAHPPRSEQWRGVIDYVHNIGDSELIDWVVIQIDVARNRENGIPDLRPRKNGPCHPLVLEYVVDRKRKALAVHKWALAAGGGASTATETTLTENILVLHAPQGTENL